MLKIKIFILTLLTAALFFPGRSQALEMRELIAAESGFQVTARSYVVVDKPTGQVVVSKNPELAWTPASLTKLVTALVVLDAKPQWNKQVAMIKGDEVGGARLATKAGVKYKVSDLFNASLIASANNATNALARSTGLTREQFVEKMNAKAKELGAANTAFVEPSGISEKNMTTAADYAKIAMAAFSHPQIRKTAQTKAYNFFSTNNKKYYHRLKNTNKLLGDLDFSILAGKTGYLDESRYNFSAEIQDKFGNDMIVVVLGSQSDGKQFQETKELAWQAGLTRAFVLSAPQVLGASAGSVAKN
jgi:D-alanyl-D-alanine carboxypeptidase